jgi:hypothetical protein
MTHIRRMDEFLRTKYKSSDDVFDLDKIPMSVLDEGYKRYNPYLLKIDHGHPLSTRRVCESTDYLERITRVKEIVTQHTFPISKEQFQIVNGNHGLYAALLIAVIDDNIEIVEESMYRLGFFRSKPTDDKLLVDSKKREWIDMCFEPIKPEDITDAIREKSDIVYHAAPIIFKEKILKDGLSVLNNNPDYQHSEGRVFLAEGTSNEDDLQAFVNTLYDHAKKKKTENPTTIYAIFVIDLKKLDKNIRFYYDINESKGIYAIANIPSSVITYLRVMKAQPLPPPKKTKSHSRKLYKDGSFTK